MNAPIPFFDDDDGVAALEAALAAARGAARPAALVALAWQLRQRDSARAAALAQQAQDLLGADPDPVSRRRHGARLCLVRGELHGLFARLDAADREAQAARQAFTALGDGAGLADAHWLLAMLAIDRGDWPAKAAALEAAAAAAEGTDPVRVSAAQAAQAYFAAFRDPAAAAARWGARFAAGKTGLGPAAGAWAEDFLAVCAHHRSDFVPAIRHFVDAYTQALASGQPRRAIIAATNTGDSLNHLNDYDGALEWMQRGLDLARRCAWPGAMGVALLQTAHTLRLLKRLEPARELLHEALALMEPLSASRNHAYALWHLSEVELALEDPASALVTCRSLARRADALQQADLQSFARCGEARALLALGQPQEALAAAHAAEGFARGAANLQVAALRVIADIHAAHALPAPAGLRAASVTLHYLEQALALAAGIERMTVPAGLLDATAREHARLGDFRSAYAFGERARVSRETSHGQEASNRAIAMQVTHQTDRARAEAEHQRSLAQAHAERLETLEQLGIAGRDITRHLEPGALFGTLHQHVQALLGAPLFALYRVGGDGRTLDLAFGSRAGEPLPRHRIAFDDAARPEARCAREQREVLVERQAGDPDAPAPAPDPVPSAFSSALCVPLLAADRLLGVMSLQALQPQAFSEREVAIFRTLCAYGAIALANADVQAQLVEQNALLEVLSVSDRLTGLYNRLRLDQVLKEEAARHDRKGSELSVVLLDLDHFKTVNDRHGHQAGDEVLVAVGRLLKRGSRQLDVVGRWGGEEFLVVCRETPLAGAAVLAEKLRGLIAGHAFAVAGRRTGSFGVAALRDGDDIEALMARADAALYRAKERGRDRVELEDPPAAAAANVQDPAG